jgi:multidrug efflux pump subunit AcrA (membrane-fusion protein)
VSLTLGEVDALVVPSVAVLKLQGSNDRYLFIDENGKAKRISVKIGRRFDDKVEVISGELKEGDKLIVVGQSKLLDGDPVEIVSK